MTDFDDEIDLVTSMFAGTAYEAVSPTKKEFFPWHRPRKQFVRQKQWGEQLAKLLGELPDDQPLRYLGLPGLDLLDLRYFHGELTNGRALCFLGFNTTAQTQSAQVELNTSLDEVKRLGQVDPRSIVRTDDIRLLSNPRSVVWKAASDLGPFDVINFDLCDSFVADDPGAPVTYYSALQGLVGLQERRAHPWLLLLTTRIGAQHFHPSAIDLLLARMKTHMDSCEGFTSACVEQVGALAKDSASLAVLDEEGQFRGGLVALLVWVLGLLHSGKVKVDFTSSLGYRVDESVSYMDLVSFAVKCTPVVSPAPDVAGLGSQPAATTDECKDSLQIPGRVIKTLNLDDLLAGDLDLRAEMETAQADLLVEARYDREEYMAWLSESHG